MIVRRICDAFIRGKPFERRSQHIEILVAIKPQVFFGRGLDQNGDQLARLALQPKVFDLREVYDDFISL